MIRIWLASAVILTLLAGCGGSEKEAETTAQAVRIGVDPDYPPFEFVDEENGQIVGFDIDLMKEICEANDWTCRFKKVPFEKLIVDLVEGDIDVIISAMTITPQRQALVAFSDPYYLSGQCIIVRKDDSTTGDVSDLRGRRVGVQAGSTGEQVAKSTDGALVFSYQDMGLAFDDLLAGNLDGILDDCPYARYLIRDHEDLQLAAVGLQAEFYGIALRTNDTERLEQVNNTLATLLGQGAFERLHLKWFGYPLLDVPATDSTSVDTTQP